VLLCSSRFGVAWEVAKEVIVADLMVRHYVETRKVLMQTMFVLTEKAKQALARRVLRPYELKLMEELGEKGVLASQYMEGRKGLRSFRFMNELIGWSQEQGFVRVEKGHLVGKYLLTDTGEQLAADWRSVMPELKEEISRACSGEEEQGRIALSRYVPWVRIMRHITPDQEKPPWMKEHEKQQLLHALSVISAILLPFEIYRGVEPVISQIAANDALKYLKPETALRAIQSGQFDENSELQAYYPKAYSSKIALTQETAPAKKFCFNCGKTIEAGSFFCTDCGAKQED